MTDAMTDYFADLVTDPTESTLFLDRLGRTIEGKWMPLRALVQEEPKMLERLNTVFHDAASGVHVVRLQCPAPQSPGSQLVIFFVADLFETYLAEVNRNCIPSLD